MNAELFFIYDSHNPWCYATSALVEQIHQAFADMPINLWHMAYYDGDTKVSKQQVKQVAEQSAAQFGGDYLDHSNEFQDSLMAANFMAWVNSKQPEQAVSILRGLQRQHFVDNNPFTDKYDFQALCQRFKLSPPGKVFKAQLSKDAEWALAQIEEVQEVINTHAFPALLLAVDDNLVLLNHNLYLTKPEAIVEAVSLEMS
ncbi:protein-disulfide isomerase [Thalassotalea ponticola]|uniref:protein-disulfide isomerase n=1 Tax=Thalassotalea ponticola TaxID=1523392 RepID=UPI0025B45BBE|nr:protein-disulfide isomerase [Thalassotalea ponticola]MDN3651589.1 protein-disulfide isomerase [Thalassotalea ponticola]